MYHEVGVYRIIQGFLRVAPSHSEDCFSFSDHLHFVSCLGYAAHESILLGGVVIPRTANDPLPSAVRRSRDGRILVALFDISLAGDLEGEGKIIIVYACTVVHVHCRYL
jgi:hypothetical protein